MKSLRLTALAAALVLGACSSATPTDPALLDSAAPSFDGGNMLGSGNNSTEDGGGMIGSGNISTEDGPGMVGSGNYSGDGTEDDGSVGDSSPTGVGTMGSGG